MQISSGILRLSLLRIFADAGERAGDCLGFSEISRRWAATGLRGSDLRYAVHEMMESGDLRCLDRDGQMFLSLGTDALHSLHHYNGELQLATLEQEAALLQARFRARPGSAPMAHRRLDDSVH